MPAELQGRNVKFTVEELTGPEVFDRLRGEWDGLLARSPSAGVFDTWEWRATWWRHYGAERLLRLLAVRDAERVLVGLWPLFEEAASANVLVAARRWRQVGNGVTGADYVDIIAAEGVEDGVRPALLAHLSARRGGWDRVDLEDFARTSPTVAKAREAFTAAHRASCVVTPRYVCPYLPLTGTFDEYMAAHPRRDNYRRRLTWIRRLAGFELRCTTAAAEVGPVMETFLELHRKRWAADGGSQGIGPREELFHRDVAPLLAARGWLRMYELCAEGKVLASVYGIERGGVFSYYQSGQDPEWNRRSVGLVLLGLLLEDCWKRGVREVDFLRGSEPYKREWASRHRETVAVRVTAWTLGSAMLLAQERGLAAARAAVRQALPAAVVEQVRRGLRIARAARARLSLRTAP